MLLTQVLQWRRRRRRRKLLIEVQSFPPLALDSFSLGSFSNILLYYYNRGQLNPPTLFLSSHIRISFLSSFFHCPKGIYKSLPYIFHTASGIREREKKNAFFSFVTLREIQVDDDCVTGGTIARHLGRFFAVSPCRLQSHNKSSSFFSSF